MASLKLRCIMGCPGLKSSYQEKGQLMLWKQLEKHLLDVILMKFLLLKID